jgi:hypothetical protein
MNKLHLILALVFTYCCGSVFAQSKPVAVLSDIPTQESMNAWRSKDQETREKHNKICINDSYKLFFAKTTCNVGELTLQFLTDESKATPAEKKVLLLVDNELLAVAKMAADNYRENTKPAALAIALSNLRMKSRADAQENLLNLYQGKITWGGYNTQRKALAASSSADFEKIIKDPALQR